MFTLTDIEEIQTGANIDNMPSWKLMEKLGFVRTGESLSSHYDKNGNQLKSYDYELNRDLYFDKAKKTNKMLH